MIFINVFKMKLIILLLLLLSEVVMSQNFDLERDLYYSYDTYREPTITNRRFKHKEIIPLIEQLKNNKDFTVNKVGTSAEGRDLFLISTGKGKKKVFLWSQMHGDEPTATAALFDIFNFFVHDSFKELKEHILNNLTIYFLPMVNPDGAERFQRRNAFEIDLNRDALRLQNPESIILKDVFDSLKADFGFNLHDQDPRYSAGKSFKPAVISFLAPAFNDDKDVDPIRERAMKLIGRLTNMLSGFVPGHIAKYSDDFEPRAFGDNFQKWGTSTILVESGGWKDDPEKQFIRKLNFILLISAFNEIANNSYKNAPTETYNEIPFNDRYLFDLILRNLTYKKNNSELKIDVAVNFTEFVSSDNKIYKRSSIQDIGDLSVFYGFEDYDLNGYEIQPGKTERFAGKKLAEINEVDLFELLSNGFTMLTTGDSVGGSFTDLPINISSSTLDNVNFLKMGSPANFILLKNGKIKYTVVNGFIQKIQKGREFKGNGIIYR